MRHSFPILLLFCLLLVVGAALVPQLDISNEPRPEQGTTLTISYTWRNAPAKVVEQHVTSRIEAMVSSVRGVESVSSVSKFGSGRITVELKPLTDVSMVRFEIAALIRQVRDKLPEDVSHPVVTGGDINAANADDNEIKLILTYRLNADLSGEQMQQVAERTVLHAIERIEGVHHVDITGTTAHYMEVEYDADRLSACGITSDYIIESIRNYAGREDVIGEVSARDGRTLLPVLLSSGEHGRRFEQMPLGNIDGKIVYLNDLATCTIREKKPGSYYRVNGMNTIYLNVYADRDASVVALAGKVKAAVDDAEASMKSLHAQLTYDRAAVQMKEFRTLVLRSSLTLSVLLLFVWLCGGRQWRYLAVIASSLLANILIAVIFYRLLNIRLHPMSMAGITVSLGIIIDSAIVMTDHYAYYRNRKALMGILAAMLTTAGALVTVFWLPDYLRHDLRDFSVVVMVNLLVAIVVASLFTPALVSRLAIVKRRTMVGRSLRTRVVLRLSRWYTRYVCLSQRPLARCGLLLVMGGMFVGALKLFAACLDTNTFSPKDEETKLYIRAEMPVGGSVSELNDKVTEVERFLSQYKEIKRYETSVRARGATIIVEFGDEALRSGFPYLLESQVVGKVITIGGADWATHGVSERGFSNSLNLQHRNNSIEIAGYDYEQLYRFAEDMCREMSTNKRVVDLAIVTPRYERQEDEFFMDYDRAMLAADSVSPRDIHSSMRMLTSDREAGTIDIGSSRMDVVVHPVTATTFDMWKTSNSYITAGGHPARPSHFMTIGRREAKNVIPRVNQEYVLRVAFNVLGSFSYTDRYIKGITAKYNSIFPVGFRCLDKTYGSYTDDGTQYWLIGLVALIVFFILAILFESLLQALAVTMLIPVSFIGLFLTYPLTGVPFGTGGFAAMVLLAGLTVNAGIYIVCQYRVAGRTGEKAFVRAFNHKIVPVILTIFSTVLGMIPFLIDGPADQPFWFSLAVGTIGGLSLSIIPLVAFLPVVMRVRYSGSSACFLP